MYTFSKLRKYDLSLTKVAGQTEDWMCAIERSYPKVGVAQILKLYLRYFSSYVHFQNLNAELKGLTLGDGRVFY